MTSTPVHARVGNHTVVVVVDDLERRLHDDETPVAARELDLTRAFEGAASAVEAAATAFLTNGCTSLSVEIGIEFALESGKVLAVLGKATSTSSLKVVATYTGTSTTPK